MKKNIIVKSTAILVILIVIFSSLNLITAKETIIKNFIPSELNCSDTNETQGKYAVLVVGLYFGVWQKGRWFLMQDIVQQYYTWYLRDTSRLYRMLIDDYGYNEENITLLANILPEKFQVPEEFNVSWVDGPSTKEMLKNTLNQFKTGEEKELSEDDTLFFVFIDHGYAYNDGGLNWTKPKNIVKNKWNKETFSIDYDKRTAALYNEILDNAWTDQALILKFNKSKNIKGFRIKAGKPTYLNNYLDKLEVSFYNNSELVNKTVFTSWIHNQWEYFSFRKNDTQDILSYEVDTVKIRFHEVLPVFGFKMIPAKVFDFEVWEENNRTNDITKSFFALPFHKLSQFIIYRLFGKGMDRLYDYELGYYMQNISAKIILILHPCFSGGFIDDLSGENRIICTSSRGFEKADSWIGPFRSALDKQVEADYNSDGNVSIGEAYEYSVHFVKNRYGEMFHPMIDDNGDKVGHYLNESGYNSDTPGMDGYLAAHTFL